MSPLQIKILLHYHTHASDYRLYVSEVEPDHAMSCGVASIIRAFVERDGLLKSKYGDLYYAVSQDPSHPDHCGEPIFSITDKGIAMVSHLMAVQIPVCKWVQPEQVPA